MTPYDFEALPLADQQVIARSTTDEELQNHIVCKANPDCWPFLCANAANLHPLVLRTILTIIVHRYLYGDELLAVKGSFENLRRYAPREAFNESHFYATRDRRRQRYFDGLRERGISISPNTLVPNDWVDPSE